MRRLLGDLAAYFSTTHPEKSCASQAFLRHNQAGSQHLSQGQMQDAKDTGLVGSHGEGRLLPQAPQQVLLPCVTASNSCGSSESCLTSHPPVLPQLIDRLHWCRGKRKLIHRPLHMHVNLFLPGRLLWSTVAAFALHWGNKRNRLCAPLGWLERATDGLWLT